MSEKSPSAHRVVREGFVAVTSSAAASAITFPLDTWKTRVQVGSGATGSLMRGLMMNMLTYPTFWGTFFAAKHYAQLVDDGRLGPVGQSFVAGVAGTTVANPFFVMKNRLQVNGNLSFVTMRDLKLGWSATQLNGSLKLTIQIPLYDYLKTFQGESPESILGASVAAKAISAVIFYPVDLVRTRQRVGIPGSIASHLNGLLRERALYKGLGVYIFATLPNFVMMMFIKDYLMTNVL